MPDAPVLNSVVDYNCVAGGPYGLDGTGQQLQINFTAGGNEGSAILNYNIYRDNALLTNVSSSPYLDTGLVNGQTHCYKITSVNANGEGAYSNVIMNKPTSIPDAPTGLSAAHGNTQVVLTWNLNNVATGGANVSPSDEGSAITAYNLYMSTGGSARNLIGSVASSIATYTATGLTNGQTYTFYVRAVNANGISTLITSGYGAPPPVNCTPSASPSTVTNVVVTSADSEMTISWSAPLNGGGLPYLYNVSVIQNSNSVSVYNANGSATTVTVTGLIDNQLYNIAIYAYNDISTDYNIYYTTMTIVPITVPITSLTWNSADSHQISISWSAETTNYAITDFLLVFFDSTLGVSGSVIVDAINQTQNDVIVQGNPVYNYTYYLNSADSATSIALTDNFYAVIFSRNSFGNSTVSNMIVINP